MTEFIFSQSHGPGGERPRSKASTGLVSEARSSVCRRPPSLCPHTAFPLCTHIPGGSSPLIRTPGILNEDANSMTSFNPSYQI